MSQKVVQDDHAAAPHEPSTSASAGLNELDEAMAQRLLASVAEGVWSINLRGHIVFVNRAAEQMFGYRVDEMLGKTSHELVHHKRPDGSPYPQIECPIYDAFRAGRAIHLDNEVLWRKDGTCFPAEYRSTPVRADGTVLGAVVTFTDVSERKAMEGQLKATIHDLGAERDMRDRFVATLSHDLRNPLAAAAMAATRLRRSDPSDVVRRQVEVIDKALKRANLLIENLLDVSRLRAGQALQLDLTEADLGTLVHETVHDMADVHGGRVVSRIAEEMWGQWDVGALRRVLENLATNALKYGSPDGTVSVDLRSQGDTAVLAVHNDGRRLSEVQMATIFTPFNRLPVPHAITQKGWGLGLAVVKGIVEALDGTVTVESTDRGGTTFFVTLPWRTAPSSTVDS